eukprot:CAMPEP_0195032480 /NCGR_PEP_ID=MMETSP0326_2-20130528/63542_1 /TAXON_ID=2866 ORGANISM="Crypthecodinium cohnii, Strain Seligo" /NCGR_SAMPLE_ID=MMETSP0326_2 /ASSEMBLY_ACC=CAM_ASM_000348 /LENGTH=33 /DNA_ID= /DNA_START= /DNA_END= /DNA_ORIENTATION=
MPTSPEPEPRPPSLFGAVSPPFGVGEHRIAAAA